MPLSKTARKSAEVLQDLGDGLVMRRARDEDAEALADFQAVTNSSTEEPDEGIGEWTRDLVSGGMPGFDASDFTLVEDTTTGAIVSSLNLISQTWTYGGVPLGVGRIELVATHPDYRRRGLVRAQMDVVHEWSAARGEKLQAITGIPWYYRRFGYELALEHVGGRWGGARGVARLPEGEPEPYTLRPATPEDLPFVAGLYEDGMRRSLVSCVRDLDMWRYDLDGRGEGSTHRPRILVVESAGGALAGCLLHAPSLWDGKLGATVYELRPGVPWHGATPSVIRYLWRTGEEYAARDGGRLESIALVLGTEHPAYHAVPDRLPYTDPSYAWYLRVPDLPDFVSHVAAVLERRLADSPASGLAGDLKISFWDDGLRMAFDHGRLTLAERWTPTQLDSRLGPRVRDALFPGLSFLQLLFGFRSVEELEFAFPDCIISSDRARKLLNTLFPKRASRVWGIE